MEEPQQGMIVVSAVAGPPVTQLIQTKTVMVIALEQQPWIVIMCVVDRLSPMVLALAVHPEYWIAMEFVMVRM